MLHQAIERMAGNASVDWDAVDEIAARADGIPTEIGERPLFGPPSPYSDHPQQRASLTIINDNNVSMR